jgi:hypothetical protein
LRLHSDVHPADGVFHDRAEATRPAVELMTDVTLGTAVVDDLFGIRPVEPTSRFLATVCAILHLKRHAFVFISVHYNFLNDLPTHLQSLKNKSTGAG